MRKVTASAVILTAIAGCGRSDVPSAEWSFDPPTDTAIAGNSVISRALSQRTGLNSDVVVSLPDETQRLLNPTAKNKMGPAFDQPDVAGSESFTTVAGRAFPSASSSGSGQAKVSIRGSAGNSAGNSSTGSSVDSVRLGSVGRSDPLAQVRAYLGASDGGSYLGSRVPYSAQVSLPASPVYTPTTTAFEEAPAVTLLEGAAGFASGAVATDDAAQIMADFNQPEAQPFSTANLLAAAAPQPPVVDFSAESVPPVSVGLSEPVIISRVPSASAGEFFEDGLPFLGSSPSSEASLTLETPNSLYTPVAADVAPIPLDSDILEVENVEVERVEAEVVGLEAEVVELEIEPFAPATAIELPLARHEADGIGTAILRDLQRNATTADFSIADASLEPVPVESYALPSQVPASAPSYGPTLQRLLDTLPEGENDSPMVSRRQAELVAASQALPEYSNDSLVEAVEYDSSADDADEFYNEQSSYSEQIPYSEQVSYRSYSEQVSEQIPYGEQIPYSERIASDEVAPQSALTASTLSVDAVAADARASRTGSSLLDGFAASSEATSELTVSTEPIQELYIPISEETADVDVSAELIRAAIATLGNEANTAQLVSDLSGVEAPAESIDAFLSRDEPKADDLSNRLIHAADSARPISLLESIRAKRSRLKPSGARPSDFLGTSHSSLEAALSAQRGGSTQYRQRIVWQ
ncbi:MAG: hypothetical protein AAFN12_05440 [Cyanobacteria bacterium J06560_2]